MGCTLETPCSPYRLDISSFAKLQRQNVRKVPFYCNNGHDVFLEYAVEEPARDMAIYKKHFKNLKSRICDYCHTMIEDPSSPTQVYHSGCPRQKLPNPADEIVVEAEG